VRISNEHAIEHTARQTFFRSTKKGWQYVVYISLYDRLLWIEKQLYVIELVLMPYEICDRERDENSNYYHRTMIATT